MNKKGMSDSAKIGLWIFGILALVFVILASTGNIKLSATESPLSGDFDGEFSDSAIADLEMGGSDLVPNATYAEAAEAFTVAYETSVDLNGTDGLTQYLAFPIEVSGDMTDLDVDVEFSATIATTELVIRNVYVVANEEGVNIDSQDALTDFSVDVDSDQDKATIKADVLADGEYVFVVEVKGISTSTIADGESLMTLDMSADSDDNDAVDEGIVTIYNKI